VDITLPTDKGMLTYGVDTGFLVFNERTYPNLINLFAQLGVETSLGQGTQIMLTVPMVPKCSKKSRRAAPPAGTA
jgi:predicted NAD/FAD-binding protein